MSTQSDSGDVTLEATVRLVRRCAGAPIERVEVEDAEGVVYSWIGPLTFSMNSAVGHLMAMAAENPTRELGQRYADDLMRTNG